MLHAFSGRSDGGWPAASLVLSVSSNCSTLYGTTAAGGSADDSGRFADGNGAVFAVNTDGTGFKILHSFTDPSGGTNTDGWLPSGGLALSGNKLYGVASFGGSFANGTVFSISLAAISPQLTFSTSQKNLVFTWPTNVTGVVLQSTTNLVSPVWTTVSTVPVVINGENIVTNPISGLQQFFRLNPSSD